MDTQTKTDSKTLSSMAAAHIVQCALRKDVTVAELADLAQSDAAFALRVLRLVNSAAFRRATEVTDVPQAVSLLGARGMRNLALSLVVTDMAPLTNNGAMVLGNCLRRGVAAREIAAALGEKEADRFFMIGLFLEVGMLMSSEQELEKYTQYASKPSGQRILLERAADLVPHTEQGAQGAAEYQLPDEAIAAIASHHDDVMPEERTAAVAWMAERMAGIFEAGEVTQQQLLIAEAAEQISLHQDKVGEIMQSLPGLVEAMAGAFERDIGSQPSVDKLIIDAAKELAEMNQHYEVVVKTLKAVLAEKEQLAKQLKKANDKLAKLATKDALTRLPNKRLFEQVFKRDIAQARREDSWLSLAVLDIDRFKKFNDTWGHKVGDKVLKMVGAVLLRVLRKGDFAARYGGEEFVVLMPNTDSEGAFIAIERLRLVLEKTILTNKDQPLNVTASFGVASIQGPSGEDISQALFECADAALYRAKDAGRNRVVIDQLKPDSPS
jgi:diguanylate cyclase (GGDEF)-like protein